tara:strand:+ start:497 stop:1183 length:687 start_codon:yes stop_codon:yes gene_type:complete
MELILFNHEYYISTDDVRSLLEMSLNVFVRCVKEYVLNSNAFVRIKYDSSDYVSCKNASALIKWSIDSMYGSSVNVHGVLKDLSSYCKKKSKRTISRSLRIEIAFRQRYACNKCATFPIPPNFEVDHIIELQDGGDDVSTNLQALCPGCHAEKTRLNRLRKNRLFSEETTAQYETFIPPLVVDEVDEVDEDDGPTTTQCETPLGASSTTNGPSVKGPVFSKYFSKNTL